MTWYAITTNMLSFIHKKIHKKSAEEKILFLVSFLLFFLCLSAMSSSVHASTINISSKPGGLTNSDLSNGLVGYWPFDGKDTIWSSTTSGTTSDVSGSGNNGVLENMSQSASPVPGKIGQALQFVSANSQYMYTPSSLNLGGTATVTISFWFNAPSIPTSPVGGMVNSFGVYGVPADGRYGFVVELNDTNNDDGCSSGGGISFSVSSLTFANYFTSCINPTISLNAWHLYVSETNITTKTITTYLDGVQQTQNNYGTGGSPSGNFGINQVNVGGELNGSNNGYTDFFNGKIEDVRIYNRALSAAEVERLYHLGQTTVNKSDTGLTNTDLGPSPSSSLTAYYSFNGKYMTWTSSTAGTVADATGNGNTGTLENMNQRTSVVAGRSGQALSFDGATAYVQGNTSIIGAGAESVCTWIKQSSFVSTANAIVANTKFIFFTSSTNNTLGLTSDGTTNAVSATNAIVNGIWQFVCGTRSASGATNLYINAALSGSANQTSGTPTTSTFNTDIGVKGTASADFFAGDIDDVRIYGRVLSAAEITQLYNETKGAIVDKSDTGLTNTDLFGTTTLTGVNSGLLAYWPFDGKYMTWTSAIAGTALDASGNGNNATIQNMNQNNMIPGKIGQAVQFSGLGNNQNNFGFIFSQSSSTLIGDPNFTVSAWAYIPNPLVIGGVSYPAVISWGVQGTGNGALMGSVGTDPTHFFVGFWDCGMDSTNTVPNNQWVHFVWVRQGQGGVMGGDQLGNTLYVNGVSVPLSQDANHNCSVNISAGIYNIGETVNFSTANYKIDDVRVYNRDLSATEVKQLYDMGK